MVVKYNGINDFYEKNRGKDSVQVLGEMNRLELIGFLATYFRLKHQIIELENEKKEILQTNENSRNQLLNKLEEKYEEGKKKFFDDFMKINADANYKDEKVFLFKSERKQSFLFFIICTLFCLGVEYFVVDQALGDTARNLNDYSDMYVPIAKVIFYSVTINLLFYFFMILPDVDDKTKKVSKGDLLTQISEFSVFPLMLVILFLPPIVSCFLTGRFWYSLFIQGILPVFTVIIPTIVLYAIAIFICSSIKNIILKSRAKSIRAYNAQLKKECLEVYRETYTEDVLKDKLKYNENLSEINENYALVKSGVENGSKFSQDLPTMHLKYKRLDTFIPQNFKSDSAIQEIVANLSAGYADNWKEAINAVRTQANHREIQNQFQNLNAKIDRFYQTTVENQRAMNNTLVGNQALLSDINQYTKGTVEEVNYLRNQMNQNHAEQIGKIDSIDTEVKLLTDSYKR